MVWNQNGIAYPAWTAGDHERLNARMARMLRRASFVIYQSGFCRDMADRYLGPCAVPGEVVHNAVDTSFFVPRREIALRSSDAVQLLVMGSHENPGRVMAALDAVSLLNRERVPARLLIAGRLAWPRAREEVEARILQAGLADRVVIRGPYGQEEAPDIYRSADILLHLKYADPCPSVVIEAMSCGLPVIGSLSGGLPELVGQGGGAGGILLSVPLDMRQLYLPSPRMAADAVRSVLEHYREFSESARRRAVERFDAKKWLERHKEIFDQVLSMDRRREAG
ncbi:MAG: glycosyltransferase family 4 protein [Elusimicrobia bacterium]|nr:glycosyltransferase family 4 protein [Elusimicrobiota bacterium]